MTGKTILLYNRAGCGKRLPDRLLSPFLILKKIFLIYIPESRLSSDVKNFLNRRGNFSEAENPLSRRIYSSSRNTRDCSREILAQSDICLHREYDPAIKNKSLSYTMLHWSIVTHAQARRIAAALRGRCFAPGAARQEHQGVLEFSERVDSDREHSVTGMADSGRKAAFGESPQQRSVPPSRVELNRNADILMRKFGDSILSFAYTYMQNRPDAEEILQDTMIAYLLNAPVFANDAHARAWLLTTARNLSMNRLRYNRYRIHADLDETLSERLAAPSKEDHSYLLEAVRKLPENMRESIYLFYWEGYSTSQIAVLLDRRESTVRSDLSRARKRLKDILKEEYDFE